MEEFRSQIKYTALRFMAAESPYEKAKLVDLLDALQSEAVRLFGLSWEEVEAWELDGYAMCD